MNQLNEAFRKDALAIGEFSVYRLMADGLVNLVQSEVPAEDAVQEFWRCCNNVSAMTGIVTQVAIKDGLDNTVLAWEHGRGYTYDGGETWIDRPNEID